MRNVAFIAQGKVLRIGREPVVVVPLRFWRKIEDLLEDQVALGSKRYLRRIARARKDFIEGKAIYPFRRSQ